MPILNVFKLSQEQLLEVKALETLCKQKEKLQGSVFLSNELNYDENLPCFFLLYQDGKLISFLSLFLPFNSEAEVSAYTHPEYRQLGCFNSLLEEACKVLMEFSIPSLLFVVEPEGKAALKALETLDVTLLHSEYLLSLKKTIEKPLKALSNTLVAASLDDLETLSELHSKAFHSDLSSSFTFLNKAMNTPNILSFKYLEEDTIIGLCHATIEETFVSIFGVCISPAFQNKLHGKAMMLHLLDKLKAYEKDITIEVNSRNKRAFHLYERLGFVITVQFDYYMGDTEKILEQLT